MQIILLESQYFDNVEALKNLQPYFKTSTTIEKTLEATEKEKSSEVREFVRKEDLEKVPRNPGT